VIMGFLRDGLNDYPLVLSDQLEFFKYHDPQTSQQPHLMWFDKKTQVVHLSPPPDKTTYVLHVLIVRFLENLLIDGQTPEFISTNHESLVYHLAANMADEGGLPIERCLYLRSQGDRFLAQVMSGPFQDKRKPQGTQSMYRRFSR